MVDESNTVTMEQANISALMDALQSAGYQIGPGNQQIIINADGHAMVVDQQVSRAERRSRMKWGLNKSTL